MREAIAGCRRDWPFDLAAIALLPDHLHLLMALPDEDADVSIRVARIKAQFTRRHLAARGAEAGQSGSRDRHRHRGVWQRRFHDHLVRDDRDFEQHLDYLLHNPVRHGHASCPHAWPWSSFDRLVREGVYERTWCCACDGRKAIAPPKPRHL